MIMKAQKMTAILAGVMALALAGCTRDAVLAHKLMATGGQTTVALYPDEATFMKVSHKEQQGGVTGMVGSAQQGLTAKQIDDQTPVKVISSDSNGTEVEVVQGPMKGTAGFVANQNVN